MPQAHQTDICNGIYLLECVRISDMTVCLVVLYVVAVVTILVYILTGQTAGWYNRTCGLELFNAYLLACAIIK